MLIDSNSLFWYEKKENFVMLCFSFSPEIEGSLDDDLKIVFAKIAEKIDLKNYDIFSANEEKNRLYVANNLNGNLSENYLNVLVPKGNSFSINDLENVFRQKKTKLCDSYKVFYYPSFAEIQKQIPNSILITQNVFAQSNEFISCSKNSYNLVIYSVDLYGDGIQDIDWEIKKLTN